MSYHFTEVRFLDLELRGLMPSQVPSLNSRSKNRESVTERSDVRKRLKQRRKRE